MTMTLAQRIREDLEDDGLPEDVTASLRTWLAADDAFNVWFLETTKGSVDDDALMGLLGGYGETQDLVESAWRTYRDDRDLAALERALTTSREMMTALQKR